MTLHISFRRIGLFVGCMLLCTMFTVHAASTCEVVPPTPLVVHESEFVVALPSPASTKYKASEGKITIVDAVVYDIVLAEVKKDAPDSPLPSNAIRSILDSFAVLESKEITGFTFSISDIPAYLLLKELENEKKFSILTRPRILCKIGTPAHIIVDNKEAPKHEIELFPLWHKEDRRTFSKIVVKQTDIRGGKEENHQNVILVGMMDANQPNLVMGGKLGDKEIILLIRGALAVSEAVPTAAHSMYDPER